jgi:hypothetical protein
MKSIERKENGYVIVDKDGKIIDDAQGYGYKTFNNAKKAMWYKFEGGKQKKQDLKMERNRIFKENPGLEKHINNFYETWFKELSRGEVTEDDLIKDIEENFGISYSKNLLKDA